uniref:Uncharacterized protein n=1 Tax=Sphaerodactylus townsendi TaxID=933632 RepID=A0ACB8F8J3_9SAUR
MNKNQGQTEMQPISGNICSCTMEFVRRIYFERTHVYEIPKSGLCLSSQSRFILFFRQWYGVQKYILSHNLIFLSIIIRHYNKKPKRTYCLDFYIQNEKTDAVSLSLSQQLLKSAVFLSQVKLQAKLLIPVC